MPPCPHLISKDPNGRGGAHLMWWEPCGSQLSRNPQDENLADSDDCLAEKSQPPLVWPGGQHLEPAAYTGPCRAKQHPQPQPLPRQGILSQVWKSRAAAHSHSCPGWKLWLWSVHDGRFTEQFCNIVIQTQNKTGFRQTGKPQGFKKMNNRDPNLGMKLSGHRISIIIDFLDERYLKDSFLFCNHNQLPLNHVFFQQSSGNSFKSIWFLVIWSPDFFYVFSGIKFPESQLFVALTNQPEIRRHKYRLDL